MMVMVPLVSVMPLRLPSLEMKFSVGMPPVNITPLEIVSLLSTRLRSLPDIVRGLREAPNTRGFQSWSQDAKDTYVQMMTYYDTHGLPAGDFGDLPKLLPRNPIGYEQFARRAAAERGVTARAGR